MDLKLLIVFGIFILLGLVAFSTLLFVGLRMRQDEQATKRGGKRPSAAPAASPAPAPAAQSQRAAPLANLFGAGPAPAANATPAVSATPVFSASPASNEILRVFHNPAGRIEVEIDGRRYRAMNEISSFIVREGFMNVVRELQVFAASTAAAPPAPEAVLPSELAPEVVPDQVINYASELPPPEPPSMRPFDQLRNLRKRSLTAQIKLKSITEQIDDVLQNKIAGTPLVQRGLQVRSGPQGNAIFLMDGKIFNALDEIPDPAVQATIRTAIAEWEKGH